MARAVPAVKKYREGWPDAGTRFDWTMVALSGWLVIGAHIDAWAHINIPNLETFFTPWHGILYSGYAALAVFMLLTLGRNHAAGYPWDRALPLGYRTALFGIIIFAFSGAGDLIWHSIFGIEANLDALLSPTHLLLALGAGLMVSGPLRAAWMRPKPATGLVGHLPQLLSLTYVLALLAYMTQWAHPFGFVWAMEGTRPASASGAYQPQAIGVLSVLLQSGILVGLVLPAALRQALPSGSLTLILGLSTVFITSMRARVLETGPNVLIVVAVLGGVAADLLLRLLQPSATRRSALRAFAFAVPVVLYTLYFLALVLAGGIWWSVHMVTGTIVLAGIVGWLLSNLAVPPIISPSP